MIFWGLNPGQHARKVLYQWFYLSGLLFYLQIEPRGRQELSTACVGMTPSSPMLKGKKILQIIPLKHHTSARQALLSHGG